MTPYSPIPSFIESNGKDILVVVRGNEADNRCILVVPPFAEEMNKCRRQFTETLTRISRCGVGSIIVDLFGTGDSQGEFAEASWEQWKCDLHSAIKYANSKGMIVDGVLACRLGCMLVADSCNELEYQFRQSVFWQPVINGSLYMNQFLRLRIAANLMQDTSKESVKDLKGFLSFGESLEVAGYELSPSLWHKIESLELLDCLSSRLGNTLIVEVGRRSSTNSSIASKRLVSAGKDRGMDVDVRLIAGEPFWNSTEIVVSKELAEITSDFFSACAVQ